MQSETIWMPAQDQLYIVTSTRNPGLTQIIAFPCIMRNGEAARLCYRGRRAQALRGSVNEVNADRARFIWEHNGSWDDLTIHAMSDKDFEFICAERRRNHWAVPHSKEELFTWYTDLPAAAN